MLPLLVCPLLLLLPLQLRLLLALQLPLLPLLLLPLMLLDLLLHQMLLGSSVAMHALRGLRGAHQHARPCCSRPATSLPLRMHTQPPMPTSCDAVP